MSVLILPIRIPILFAVHHDFQSSLFINAGSDFDFHIHCVQDVRKKFLTCGNRLILKLLQASCFPEPALALLLLLSRYSLSPVPTLSLSFLYVRFFSLRGIFLSRLGFHFLLFCYFLTFYLRDDFLNLFFEFF